MRGSRQEQTGLIALYNQEFAGYKYSNSIGRDSRSFRAYGNKYLSCKTK